MFDALPILVYDLGSQDSLPIITIPFKVLPSFREWAEAVIGLNIDDVSVEQKKMPVPAVVNKYDAVLTDFE